MVNVQKIILDISTKKYFPSPPVSVLTLRGQLAARGWSPRSHCTNIDHRQEHESSKNTEYINELRLLHCTLHSWWMGYGLWIYFCQTVQTAEMVIEYPGCHLAAVLVSAPLLPVATLHNLCHRIFLLFVSSCICTTSNK